MILQESEGVHLYIEEREGAAEHTEDGTVDLG